MKHNWEYKQFKQLAQILYGYPFESGAFNTDLKGMPLIRIRDVKPGCTSTFYDGTFSKDYIIRKGDYLIGMDGEFNIAPWKSEDALLNQRVCKISSLNEEIILTKFLFYYLKRELKKIEDRTPFVTVKHLSAKVLNSINTPNPPLKIQQKIVSELDAINEGITELREQIKDLDNLGQSLFYEMFGDPILNPKGWEVKKIYEVADVIGGSTPKTNIEEYWNGDLCWITPAEVKDNKYIYDTERHLTNIGRDSSSLKLLPINTVLLTSRAPIGKVAIAKTPLYCNQGFKNLVCKNDKLHYEYAYAYLTLITDLLIEKGRGATFKEISKKTTESIEIPLPPLSLQNQFAERIEAIESMKEELNAQIADAQTLLDSRMDYWFN